MARRGTLLTVCILLASLSAAQTMPGMATGRTMLVLMPDVSKELKVTKEQNKLIQQAIQEMEKNLRSGNLSGINFMDPFSAIDPKVEAILDEPQRLRLEELFIQKNLGFALLDKRVAEKLGLTEAQGEQVHSISKETKAELLQLTMNVRSNGDLKKLKDKQKEVSDRMLAVLTGEQPAKLEIAKGKTFKFKT